MEDTEYDVEGLDNDAPIYYASSLERLAIKMYGKPESVIVANWNECNSDRYHTLCAYQEGLITLNQLMKSLLNLDYHIEEESTLATSVIQTIAMKIGNTYRTNSALRGIIPGEDELQDVLLRVMEQLKTAVPVRETMTPWLISTVSGHVSKHVRDRLRRDRRGLGEDVFDLIPLESLEAADMLLGHNNTPQYAYETSNMVELLEDLSPREKEVMMMSLEGLSYQEIADDLDISTKTVDATIQRARNKLAPSRADYYKE